MPGPVGPTPAAPVPRIVIDTNIWLDCLMFDDPRLTGWVQALSEGRCRALICRQSREEWLRMCRSPRFTPRSRPRDTLTACLDAWSEHCPDPHACALRPRDRDDQVFIDLAVQERASHLLTRDKALLKLRRKALDGFGLRILAPGGQPADQPPWPALRRSG